MFAPAVAEVTSGWITGGALGETTPEQERPLTTTHTRWSQVHEGERVEMTLTDDGLYFEVGSDQNLSKRGHEGAGGTLSLEEFRSNPRYFSEFPGFRERVLADLRELE